MTRKISCPTQSELQHRLDLDDGAESDRVGEIDAHVETCAHCKKRLAAIVASPGGSPGEEDTPPNIPGYEFLAEIGAGGMGRVWKARVVDLDREVAVKVLTAGTPEWIERFRREAAALARLDHENIVKIHTFDSTTDQFFYVMEYLPTGSIAAHRRSNPDVWTDRRSAELIAAAARAVAHMHRHRIIHRDIKPANILLTESLQPKVADFGLVKVFDEPGERTRTGQLIGTPNFMAPEQTDGNAEVGPSVDVYGLGAVLYFLLTERPPVPADGSLLDILNRVRNDDPITPKSLRPTLPRDLETICLKCLRKKPGDRYATADDLADDLERYLGDRPIVARPIPWPARATKWVRRNPVQSIALTLLVVAAVAFSVAWRATARAGQKEQEAADATVRKLEAERNEAVERENRVRAERDQRLVKAEAAVASALRRGDPRGGLDVLRKAEADGMVITPIMRLAEVDALEATGHADEARKRLEEHGRDFRHSDAARRDLRLGDFLLGLDDDKAEKLIRTSLASDQLPPTDRLYARGILASGLGEAVKHLRGALTADPYHLPARRVLAVCLIVSGRQDEAIRVAEDGRLLYQDHPDFLRALFLAHGFKGDEGQATKALDQMKPSLREDLHPAFDVIARDLPLLSREFQASVYGDPPAEGVEARRHLGAELRNKGGASFLLQELAPGHPVPDGQTPFVRLPPACRRAMGTVWEFFEAGANNRDPYAEIARDDTRTARLAAEAKQNPEGFVAFGYAMVLFIRANSHQQANPKDGDGFRAKMAEAGAAFEVASRTPGVIDARQVALEKAIFCFALAGRPNWAGVVPNEEWVRKAAELTGERLKTAEAVHVSQIRVLTIAARNAGDYSTARRLLDSWEKRHPGDLAALKLRAEVEFRAGAFHPALTAAEAVLAKETSEAEMLKIRTECQKRVQR